MSPIFAQAASDWREMRAAFDDVVYAAYTRADSDLCGALLNKRARAAGIDPLDLFTGPHLRVVAYASDELLEWFSQHQRPHLGRFERQWLQNHRGAS